MTRDPAVEAHKSWIGMLQPVGVVVAPSVLVQHQAILDHNAIDLQENFKAILSKSIVSDFYELPHDDIKAIFSRFLNWRDSDLISANAEQHILHLPEFAETLMADWFVPGQDDPNKPLMYVKILNEDISFDISADIDAAWSASPQIKFERFLREKQTPIGILLTKSNLRLVYCPHGETSGFLTFPIQLMTTTSGRMVLSGLQLLLGEFRVFTAPEKERLKEILWASRQYQNVVSEELAKQVLSALYELTRGFQTADERSAGKLLESVKKDDINQIYSAAIAVLMRLVFTLYAEDRNLFPANSVFNSGYSVKSLFERLQADSAQYPDSMDQRFGAWSQLLALFRLVYDGISAPGIKMPARHGHLFDPDRFRFLEGRVSSKEKIDPPKIPDHTIHKILQSLMIIEGELVSYRALDVEQIGSVYETLMGFKVEISQGATLPIKSKKSGGAPLHIDLDALLKERPKERPKLFKKLTDHDAPSSLETATTVDELKSALDRRIAKEASSEIVAKGSLILQPTDARRASGSHYTPRALTSPIVEKALEPIFAKFGTNPTAEQILALKICDPAMGSGAFLVEVVRQLSERLVISWKAHKVKVTIPPDEGELLYARRKIASHCIYGVDRNPMAVDLAKLSIWLATFAKDHAFTFLDHALKCGDSLVGLSLKQITKLSWDENSPRGLIRNDSARVMVSDLLSKRQALHERAETATYDELVNLNENCSRAMNGVRQVADMIVAAFFSGSNDRQRKEALEQVEIAAGNILAAGMPHRMPCPLPAGVSSFHWEIEFPEIFGARKGFDCFVGNPPFAGKNNLAASNHEQYPKWLQSTHVESHGNSDLVAHFFRRAFNLLAPNGSMGLIATNTIAQGDTRSSGLRWICNNGGEIYYAQRNKKWPGQAAVVVSVVHISKGPSNCKKILDGRNVNKITAFLFHAGGNDDPINLAENSGKSFQGSIVLGMGFTFDDGNSDASPIVEMNRLIAKNPKNKERIFPYIGGDEVNESPTHAYHRYVINFGDMSEDEARSWPDLMDIVENKVKPERLEKKDPQAKTFWWRFLRNRPEMASAIKNLDRVLVTSRHTHHWNPTFMPVGAVFSDALVLFAIENFSFFAVLQSSVHEVFARFFSGTMGIGLRYSPSDCFETFPLPIFDVKEAILEDLGREYFGCRAKLMIDTNSGLTDTYNRFHDPHLNDPGICRLRELHANLDREVLEAYGWADINSVYEFIQENITAEESEASQADSPIKYRYRWPDDIRDEVLARLLALNAERAAAQSTAATPSIPKSKKSKMSSKSKKG